MMMVEKSIVYKLLHGDEITKDDVRSMHLFGDDHIDKLFEAGQSTVRHKAAEALMRESWIEVEKDIASKEAEGSEGNDI